MVQRDGRTWEPAVAAGSVEAAAASDMFVMVMKTGEKGAGRGHVSIQYMSPYSCGEMKRSTSRRAVETLTPAFSQRV